MAGAPHQGRVGLRSSREGSGLDRVGSSLCHGCPRRPAPPRPAPAPRQTHLQGQLVSEEGADEVAGIPSNPAQKEPQRQRLVHVARPAGFDVLAAAEEGDAGSGQEGARAREAGTSPVSPSCWQGELREPLGAPWGFSPADSLPTRELSGSRIFPEASIAFLRLPSRAP